MGFIEELKWRGMLDNLTPGLEDFLKNESPNLIKGYIGFDPTAPSLTIGNYVQVMLLKLFQKHGYQPVVLMGGATGRIGDPSGKDKERELISEENLQSNIEKQQNQLNKLLSSQDINISNNKVIILNNYVFYENLNLLKFLREIGKEFTISYMLNKESVENRLKKGISFTEFSYQIIQAYDYYKLFDEYGCNIQMGGSDQWGNITSGLKLIKKKLNKTNAYAITTPLLTKSDGTKFGKSGKGNIWLDENLTSPYKFYQFWLNTTDDDLPKYIKYFSFKSRSEITSLINIAQISPKSVKEKLAAELTVNIHSEETYKTVKRVSDFLFNKNTNLKDLKNLSKTELQMIAEEIPSHIYQRQKIQSGIGLLNLMVETEISESISSARRMIKQNAVSVNNNKVNETTYSVNQKDIINDEYIFIDKGKKNKHVIQIKK